jgi:imidazolonepropionase
MGPISTLDPRVPVRRELDGAGALLTPGLIDCHTHLVYAGDRAREFELRLQGATYESIARAGGGIRATVKLTREADEATLFAQSERRLLDSMRHGVTTVEIKSGYGLSLVDELKCLRVARRLGERHPVRVRSTLLAAHALPPEFEGPGRSDLVTSTSSPGGALRCPLTPSRLLRDDRLPAREPARQARSARCAWPGVKLHAGSFPASRRRARGGFGALSADHLEHLDAAGAAAMACAGTVAVLLPGAYYTARHTRRRRSRCCGSIACRWRWHRLQSGTRPPPPSDAEHGVHALSLRRRGCWA